MRILQGFMVIALVLLGIILYQNSNDGGPGMGRQVTVIEPSTGDVVVRSETSQRRIDERDRLRQQAAASNETDFQYVRYRIDTSGETPKACFGFSAPLDPDTDYSTYVRFRPALRAAYSVEGRELCAGGLSFADSRTATLLAGFPAADGRTLGEDESVPVEFTDRPAYVGFKGSGVILPRLDADGLPLETVNVDSVRIRVLRVNDRALVFKSITEGTTRSQGGYSSLYGEQSPWSASEEIWSGEMDIENDPNKPVVSVFPLADVLATLEPGAYFVEVTDNKDNLGSEGPPAQAQRWIITTDLALTSYRGTSGLDVTVRSLQSAKSVPRTIVQLIAENNEILASRESDEFGAVNFPASLVDGRGNLRPRMLMAYGPAGDFAVLDFNRSPIDLSSENIGGRYGVAPVDAFAYTERGIYRPGETVNLTALLRDTEGRSVSDRAGNLVVYRPNGLEASNTRFEAAEFGAVQIDFDLPRAASRGVWRASVEIDGMEDTAGQVTFSVEDFVPQRIAVDLEADEEAPLRMRQTREIEVDARFLYGAPGAGLEVVSEARISEAFQPFEAWKGYRFGRHDDSYSSQVIELPDQVTDGAGKAVIPVTAGSRGSRSDKPLRLQTLVSVLEPGGRAVSKSVSFPYHPRTGYLGIKPRFDGSPGEGEAAIFDVVMVDRDGAAREANLDWKVIQIYYDYDWYRDGSEWRWRRTRYVKTVNEGVLNIAAGETGEIRAENLDRWGDHQLIVSDQASSMEASRQFWVGWGGRAADGVEAPDRVRISAPEENPEVGTRAEISILPPYAGEAQIVVATDKVQSILYRSVDEDGAQISLPVTEDWGNGAYVMVTVFSPRDAIRQPKPRRAVGVTYVPVDTSSRTFEVSFDAPEVARPRGEQTISVNLENGPDEPVFLTLAAVDEGILALTNFATPDPVDHYFGKKALRVSLHDDYGRLLDPNLAAPGDVRSGGDELGGEGLSVVPTKTVALFSGLVEAGEDGSADITFPMPDFNGEVRLMAVAWSETGIGSGDQAMIIRDPVPTELSLPRFLAPGDEAVATASIDNVELGGGVFTGQVRGTDGVVADAAALQANLASGERSDAAVTLRALEEGINTLTFSVAGPEDFSVDHDYQIQTRSAFLPVTTVSRELLEPGSTYGLPTDVLADRVPGSGEVVVSFSPLPVDAGSLYASLSRYPYGCTEQLVSRAMPLLYAEQLAALSGNDDDSEARSARTKVQQAIDTLLNRQSPDGAIGLWREGDRDASPWIGAFAVDFLHRARDQGYGVPAAALNRAAEALQNVSQGEAWRVYGYNTNVWESEWHSDTEQKLMLRSAPYALYVLARAGKVDISRLRYMHDRELGNMDSPLAKAHLGAGLAYMGDRSRAISAFRSAVDSLGYDNTGDYYQTPLRDLAGVLALAAEAGLDDVLAELSERLSDDIPEPEELMTQEKVFLLLATNALTGGQPEPDIDAGGLVGSDRFLLDGATVASGATFTNGGVTPIWRTTLVTGAPTAPPPPASSDLRVTKRIFSVTGSPVDLGAVRQGDRLVVRLTLDPGQNRNNPLIVADLLPAGFEIEAVLRPSDADDDGAFSWLDGLDYPKIAEARDDRFIAAIDVRRTRSPRLCGAGRHAGTLHPPRYCRRGYVSANGVCPVRGGRGDGAAEVVSP